MSVHPEFLEPASCEVECVPHAEHAKCPPVVRVIEMVGVSDKGWDDAARQLAARASQTLRHVTGLEVIRNSAVIRDGKILEYHVDARVAFVAEPAEIEA
jgi:flavin-binding protein dodecin